MARQILEKPEIAAFDSTSVVACRCQVGTSTVSRLARHLGFANYRELRRVFQDHLRTRSQTSNVRMPAF
ncbi:transcriptional regulator [Mesorhizobium sp. IMUNJ 23033]|uniref:transcriptional regulator n=1 Tax=Mesorhizobium sp. IMUNJ 23033 TaxID=3378039 RepID=UPI00384B95C3